MRFRSLKYILLIFLFNTLPLWASQGGNDTFGYLWTTSSVAPKTDFNWVDIKDGNSLFFGAITDQVSSAITLPFTFNFYGQPKNQIYVSANGWISFKNPGTTTDPQPNNLTLPNALAQDSMMAVYWDDLSGTSSQLANVYVKTLGTAPFRRFVVQWDLPDITNFIEFQVILYETTNLFKFQYGKIDLGTDPGLSATIGLQATATEALQYAANTSFSVDSYFAILWSGKRVNGTDAFITPTSGNVNSTVKFTYTFNNINPLGTDKMGKLDRFAIATPFVANPVVSSIKINNGVAAIQNSLTAPTARGYASWGMVADSLVIQTASMETIDSLVVTFYQDLPTTVSTGNAYVSSVDAVLDSSGIQLANNAGWSVDVTGATEPVDYYEFSPATDQTIKAGGSVSYTVTARDRFGNAVVNSDSIIFSASGSSSATFSPSARLAFANSSTVSVSVSDQVTGSFTVKAVKKTDSSVSGTSGLVTVNPGNVSSISVLSSTGSITAGTTRQLQVALLDAYGNRAGKDSSVTFTRIVGTGVFSNSLSSISDLTNVNGEAVADYTASQTAGGSDSIRVSYGTVTTTLGMAVVADNVSYYGFSPSTNQTITAGGSVSYTVTAYDQYDNVVANSDSIIFSASGSSSATFSPSARLAFANSSTVSVSVSDQVTGSFTVKAVKKTDSSVSGTSGLVTVNAAPLNYVLVRTAANNGGIVFADSIFTTDNTVTFYAAGYDVYNNYIQDESVTWSSSGTLETVSSTGTNFQFAPSTPGSGRITATPSVGVSADSTGLLTVNSGALAQLIIQTTPADGGPEITDSTITADQTLTMYSVGYDVDGNYLGRISSTWTPSGVLSGNVTPANPTDSLLFTAVAIGAGSVNAASVSNSAIDDNIGNITVSPGAITRIIIRDGPNDAGSEVGAVNMNVGDSYTFYANGYDSDGNFNSNVAVNWSTTGTLSGLSATTNASSTTLSPTSPGSGTVVTSNSSGYTDDATGTITVSSGSLSSMEIRTARSNGGVVLNDSILQAGSTLTLYAAGYDLYGNFIGDQAVTWTIEKVGGDSIGFFTTTTANDSNIFNARVVNSGRLKITSGSVNDYSGVIKVTPGAASSVSAITATTVSGQANSFIADSLGVQVKDAYGNVVPGVNVAWTTPTDGQLSPGSIPPDITDSQGISRSKWRLRSSSSVNDTAFATPTGLSPVQFIASVLSSSADSLNYVSGSGQSDTIGAALIQPFVIQVVDSLGNPVPNVNITFSIASTPNRASGQALSTVSTTTDASGKASTILTLGDKVGTYTVSAYNGSLLNSPQSFSATATTGTVKSLEIVSGNGQTDTVGTIPVFPLKIKALDSGSNAVSGVALTWTATSNGLVNGASSASRTTNAAGVDSVSWTLRTTAGADTVTVSAAGVTTKIYTATAVPGAAAFITSVSGNNRTTVAGSHQKIVARITDQYANSVSGTQVTFTPANRMSALNSTSNDSGLVSAVYTTPSDSSLTVARALMTSPADTALFNVYGIQYVSNSLSPKSASTGQTVIFYLQVNNPGLDAVPLDTSQSTLTITYNNIVSTTKLDSPLTLAAGSQNMLKFKPVTIAGGFPSGTYTPEIKLIGSGGYSSMNGSFITDPGELSISPLEINFVSIPNAQDTVVVRGGSITEIQMQVTNNSNLAISGLTADLTFSPDYGFVETFISGPTSLLGGQSGTYRYSLNIPAASSTGLITVDGNISGSFTSNNEAVNDLAANVNDQFRVIPSASLAWTAYAPNPLSEGQSTSFTADVRNNGSYDILLNKDSTYLQFGTQTFLLSANQALAGNGATTTLNFTTANLALTAGSYSGTLVIRGTEVGNDFRDTLLTATSGLPVLTVQTVANITTQSLTLSDTQVSQGESSQTLSLQIQNAGGATALINAADSIRFNYNSTYSLTLTSGQTFPLAIPGGSTVTLTYAVTVDNAAVTGADTFTARIAFSDSNSTTAYVENNTAISDSWTVLSKANLNVAEVAAAATKVSQGQTGLNLNLKIKNLGQTAARVDTLYPDFKRNINSYSTATTFPFTLAGGDSQTVTFSVAIDNNAATGMDSIRGVSSGANTRTAETLAHTSAYLDNWRVYQAPDVVINSVTSSFSRVNRGQKNVPVNVVVTNQGQATVLIDSLKLANTPANSTIDTRLTAIDSLTAGQSKTYSFSSDISSSAGGSIFLGAEFFGRDAVSNAAVNRNNPIVHDTLTVGDAAVLVIDSVYTDVANFTQGQTNIRVNSAVRNSGSTRIQLNAAGINIRRITAGAGAVITATRVSPATLPSISPGDVVILTYDISSATTPRDSGFVEFDGYAYGTDVISDQPDSVFSAVKKDTAFMDTPAAPTVIAIANPVSVTEGEQNIPVNLTLRNRGSAKVRVESVDLNFYNGAGLNANADYTRQYNTPPLPFVMNGWQDTTVSYVVGVVDSAANLGTVNHRGVARGTELNRAVALSDSSANLSSWTVFGTGALEVVSVVASRDSVSTGDQNIPVQVNIKNGGTNPVQIDTVRLSINGGSYAAASLVIYPNDVLQPSTSKVYTLNVDVLSTSSSGVATLNARVEGVDRNTAQTVSDPAATTTDSWLVQQAFNASITDNTPTQVSTNQSINTVLTLTNSGEARLLIDTSLTTLYPKNSPSNFVKLSPSSPRVVEGKGSVDLIFNPTTSTVAFSDSLILNLQGTENSDSYAQNHTAPNILIVQDQAVMVIDSTVAVKDSVSQGETEDVAVYIRNTGTADLVVDSLVFANYGLPVSQSPALPYTIAGGTQQKFDTRVAVSLTGSTGNVSLDVRGVGHDGNSAAAANDAAATFAGQWFVATPADIFVSAVISADTLVSQGQTGLNVDVKIKNNGQTPVTIGNVQLSPKIGLYKITWPAFNVRLNGNDSLTFTAAVNVRDNSATGKDSLYARASYTNIYTSAAGDTLSTTFHSWRIRGVPKVNILSVSTDPTSVSQGQTNIPVQVRVENSGTSDATINSVALNFTSGNTNYSTGAVSPSTPVTLRSGLEQIFTIPVTVNGNAATGLDSLFGQLNITEVLTGNSYDVIDSTIIDTWTVQSRAVVTIDSVVITPPTASTGQSGLSGQVYLSSAANGAAADVLVDSVALNFSLAGINQNGNFSITRQSVPTLPARLQQGNRLRLDFNVDVNAAAGSGNYVVDGYTVYHDANDNGTVTLSNALIPDTLTVQQKAVLLVDAVRVVPDTISQGQTHGRIYVDIRNSGEAPAEIDGSSLSFTPVVDFQEIYLTPATPFILSGSARDTMVYSFVAPASITGQAGVDANVSGTDVNTGTVLNASSSATTFFEVQTAASPTVTQTTPNSTPGEQNEQFRVKIYNSGQATIILDPATTTLNIVGTAYKIPLDVTSPTVILAAPDTTVLVFRDTLLTGLATNEYALTVSLNGTTNQAAYSNELDAGSLAYGQGLIVINTIGIVGSDHVLQGEKGMTVNMVVSNTSIPLVIDSTNTILIFRDHVTSGQYFMDNLHRLDTLTILPVGTSTLKFSFDVPLTHPVGQTDIYGQISLDNGSIVNESSVYDELFVQSGANAHFLAGSVQPDSVVRNETVSFSLSYINTGTSDLSLNADSSYIDFPGTTIPRATLSAKFTLGGGDTTRLVFNSVTIPSGEANGLKDIHWRLYGTLINGNVYTNDSLETSVFEVIPSAQLVFARIIIDSLRVPRGERDVPVLYRLQNNGASDAVVSNINFNFNQNGQSVTSDWLLVSSGLFPDTVLAGAQKDLRVLFNVAEDARLGADIPAPAVTYNDIRVPSLGSTSGTVLVNDTVQVIAPGEVRIDSLTFAAASPTPNAPNVNIDQRFILATHLSNNGGIDLDSIWISLNRNNNSVGRVRVAGLPAGTTKTVDLAADSLGLAGNFTYTAVIDSARDSGGRRVTIAQPLDNSEIVIVQQPSRLSINSLTITAPSSATDSSVAVGQTFTVKAVVDHTGDSGFGSGRLQLNLPGHFSFDGSAAEQTISSTQLSAVWQVRADQATPAAWDTMRVFFSSVPVDVNTAAAVDTGNSIRQTLVRAQSAAQIAINVFEKTAPQASRDTLSTGQTFTLRSVMQFNASSSKRKATLQFPAGYAVQGASEQSVTTDTLLWTLRAPDERARAGVRDTVFILFSATDVNSGLDLLKRDTLTFVLQQKSRLRVLSAISAPQGATDGFVSTGQKFVLKTEVRNEGQAGIDGSGTLRLEASGGLLFASSGTAQLTHNGLRTAVYLDTVIAPDSGTSGWLKARITAGETPLDINSLDTALVVGDTDSNNVILQKRADLALRFIMPDAVNDSLIRATNQSFEIHALVSNSGEAGVDTSSGRHQVRLDISGTGLTFVNGDQADKFFSLNDTIRWQVRTSTSELNAPFRVSVLSAPLDANENISAFRTAASAVDSLILSARQINDINLTASFEANVPLQGDTLIVSTDQDSILVQADVIFDRQLDKNKKVVLTLPPGYTSQDGNLTRFVADDSSQVQVSWYIKSKSLAGTHPDTLHILASGVSTENGNLLLQVPAEKYIRTVPKATLSLNVRVDAPQGALDSTVSLKQAFRLRGVVQNLEGASPVSGTGVVELNFDHTYFSLIDSSEIGLDNNPRRTFTVGQPFFWWIRADQTTPGIRSVAQLTDLVQKALRIQTAHDVRDVQRLDAKGNPVPSSAPQDKKRTAGMLAGKASASSSGSDLVVRLIEVPRDANSGQQAAVSNTSDLQTMRVENPATIAIGTIESPATVTTGQTFNVTVHAGAMSANLENPQAVVLLPEGFEPSSFVLPVNAETQTAVFAINVPANYNGPETDSLRFVLVGIDNNTNEVTARSDEKKVGLTFQRRPNLIIKSRIVTPQSAAQGVLSFGQKIELQVWVENSDDAGALAYADITGQGIIAVDSALIGLDGFKLAEGSVAEQVFTRLGESGALRWVLRAPQTEKTYNIQFAIKSRPNDVNSLTPVDVKVSQTSHPVRVKQKEITITMVDSLIGGSGLVRGQTNLPMLAFNVSNEGYGDSLFVNGLTMGIYGSNGAIADENLLSPESLVKLFNRFRIVNYNRFLELRKNGGGEPQTLAEVTVDASMSNPLELLFNQVDKLSINPDTSETLIVLADLQSNARSLSFRAVLNQLKAYDVSDTIALALLDKNGNDFDPGNQETTAVLTVIPDNPEEAFSTYPNPFGRRQTYARINFYLTETADVDIRIFTLLGELVWHRKENALPGNRNYNHITWDGKNDKGQTVLNGVYICTIQITPTGGGTAKRYITKVAYIK